MVLHEADLAGSVVIEVTFPGDASFAFPSQRRLATPRNTNSIAPHTRYKRESQ